MKPPIRFAAAVFGALAMTALAVASSASATTLETKGVAENAAVTLKTTIAPGGSFLESETFGVTVNTCTTSTVEGTTVSPFTVADPGTIGGPITTLSWSNCTEGNPVVETDAAGRALNGTFNVQHIAGTTSGTVRWNGSKIVTPSPFGFITCTTNNTVIGTINGKKEGTATFTVNAVVPCTVVMSLKWSGTYTFTSPSNLGVVA
jgi:hypothetical protein